jgi:hypothetical protein
MPRGSAGRLTLTSAAPLGQEELQDPGHVRLEAAHVRVVLGDRRAECDAADAEQGRLLGRRQGAGVPQRVAQVGAEVDPGQDEVHALPVMGTEGHAIGGRAVDAVRFDAIDDPRGAVGQRLGRRDGMAGRRLLDVGCHDPHIAELPRNLRQGGNARAVDTVVIRDEDAHGCLATRDAASQPVGRRRAPDGR